MPVLSMSASLLLVLVLRLDGYCYSLLVGDLGNCGQHLCSKLPLELFNRHVHMCLSKAGQQRLMRNRVPPYMQGWVFFGQPRESRTHFIQVCLGLGVNGHRE